MTVPAADDGRGRVFVLARLPSPITRTRQDAVQFLLQHHLNETAHPCANAVLDRIEPIVEKHDVSGDSRRLCGSLVMAWSPFQRLNACSATIRMTSQRHVWTPPSLQEVF
jgi:hypothetical protein